eukprot:CAMPEP_0181373738 /NCGR_PEP_ID=MMETSP1106-20121128/15571_1 /TAXON_ID=81844 /ORGANISM="Mantoniella antarctica, Strain SL-175" /LENGTH=241 /DNA_ID=CAMNT_0023491521 /DNA_START=76 /DNA_END=797 /DNA_ORIENTATION=-
MGKGNKSLAPGDAFRREQKKKEIAKNKASRKTQRDETLKSTDVGTLKAELARLEQQKKMGLGSNEKNQRIKQLEDSVVWHEEQRVANEAKPPAPAPVVPKVKNIGALQKTGLELMSAGTGARGGAGLGERRHQDSVYYHPTLNPTGRPPPGKPQKYKAMTDREDDKQEGDDDDDDDDEEEIDEEFGFGGIGLPLAPPPVAASAELPPPAAAGAAPVVPSSSASAPASPQSIDRTPASTSAV